MDIGTAKPPLQEMSLVTHHLFDIIDPDEDFSLAQYQEMAYKVIDDIHSRNKTPFLVGGSGQYVWAVLEGWEIPRIPPNLELRKDLENKAANNGIDDLYRQLQGIDPVASQKIDKRNIRRVIRALEVSLQAKTPISELQKKKTPDYGTLIIGLTAERAELYQKIDLRVDQMVQQGLIEETKILLEKGYNCNLPSMSSIGYRQIGMILKGEMNQEEAIRQIKTDSHRFVRHQYAWFRLKDERINWFNVKNGIELEVMNLISNSL
jgi:tRNA dimethylallyltransferase